MHVKSDKVSSWLAQKIKKTLNNVGWIVVQCPEWLGDRMTLNQTKTGEKEEVEEED